MGANHLTGMRVHGLAVRRLLAGVLSLVTLLALGGAATPSDPWPFQAPAFARTATPVMGFNGWNAFGCDVTADLVERTADAMVTTGLAAAGYRYVNLDDCWMAPTRDAAGQLRADPAKFPHGIAAVAAYVHARGLLFGIYADAGTATCAGYPGSLGHEAQDAATFAAWGVDYVKYDQCSIPWDQFPGLSHAQVDQRLYATFAQALATTGRAIVLSVCTAVDPESAAGGWAPALGNLWRTTPDIEDTFASVVANATANARLVTNAVSTGQPTRWSDPDMLEIGNGGLTVDEERAQLSLWAVMSAPLIAGTSLAAASPQTIATLTNSGVLAVDQDPLGAPATVVLDHDGLLALTKPLAGGDIALVLLNATTTPANVSVPVGTTGVATDLWSGATLPVSGQLTALVPGHSAVSYRLHPQ